MTARILTLDLGTVSGWYFQQPGANTTPQAGVWRLPKTGDRIGEYVAAFEDRLMMAVTEHAPSVIAFEQPILPSAYINEKGRPALNTNITTLRKLYGIAAVVERGAYRAGVRCFEAPVPTIKKALTGSGRAEKPQMENAYESAHPDGWPLGVKRSERNHVADAYGLWVLVARTLEPELTLGVTPDTPLFR